MRPAASSRDPLQRINGINPEIERLLNVQGISRFSQIAGWTQGDVERFDRLLGSPGRVRRESWVEQAQILSRTDPQSAAPVTAMPSATTPPAAAAVPPPASDGGSRPVRLADAMAGAPAAAPVVVAAAAAIAAPATAAARSDIGALRSVKSEAFQGRTGQASGQIDDLKRIRGVGVLIEKRLNALGITSYEQIANWTADDIARFSQQLDFKGRIERENWVEQARILSAGGQTEFSQRVDRGEVETSRPKV